MVPSSGDGITDPWACVLGIFMNTSFLTSVNIVPPLEPVKPAGRRERRRRGLAAATNVNTLHAFLCRAVGDCKKVFAVSLGEPSISFGQIRGDGNACPV